MSERKFNFNIGTIIFGALFLYLVITVIIYATTNHVTSYMVTAGTLSQNEVYSALVLRNEKVVNARSGGYVNYYVTDNSKVAVGDTVCSVGETRQTLNTDATPDMSEVRDIASGYSRSYNRNNFSDVYDMKDSLDGALLDAAGTDEISGEVYDADVDGVISYTSDGYEDLTADSLTADDFDSKSYRKSHLRSTGSISANDPVYRVITSETWSAVVQLSELQNEKLKDRNTIRVRFLKDGQTETGNIETFQASGKYYAQITFTRGMIRYCNDRFLDIELVTNTSNGLKIPKSSVVEKEFYVIPSSFGTKGGNSDDTGFLLESEDEEGRTTTDFRSPTIYEEKTLDEEDTGEGDSGEDDSSSADEEYYFVDKSSFEDGDILLQENSNNTFTIGQTAKLQGVYCTNKGFAVFRKVDILDENEEYCIVSSNTSFGISQYDYIVENGSEVKEEDLIK